MGTVYGATGFPHASLLCFAQDSGQHLSVVDDCNDHMLTVWDWQKKSKIAEIKVKDALGCDCSRHRSFWFHLFCSEPFAD